MHHKGLQGTCRVLRSVCRASNFGSMWRIQAPILVLCSEPGPARCAAVARLAKRPRLYVRASHIPLKNACRGINVPPDRHAMHLLDAYRLLVDYSDRPVALRNVFFAMSGMAWEWYVLCVFCSAWPAHADPLLLHVVLHSNASNACCKSRAVQIRHELSSGRMALLPLVCHLSACSS